MSRGLTLKQAQVLAFLDAEITTKGRPPTLREIAAAFGFRSTYAARCHLMALEHKGHVRVAPDKVRAITLTRGGLPARVDKDRAVVLRGATACGRPAVFMPVTRAGETRRAA